MNTLGRRFEVGQRPVLVLLPLDPSAGDMNLFLRLLRLLFGSGTTTPSENGPRPSADAQQQHGLESFDPLAGRARGLACRGIRNRGGNAQPRLDSARARGHGRSSSPRTAAGASGATKGKAAGPGKSLGLEANPYLPISREEIKKTAKGMNRFGNPWFGRRDLIPPTDDPRTNLIDRAMVTQGLLSPSSFTRSTPSARGWIRSSRRSPHSNTRPPLMGRRPSRPTARLAPS